MLKTLPEAVLLSLLPRPDALSPECSGRRAVGQKSSAGESSPSLPCDQHLYMYTDVFIELQYHFNVYTN